MEEGGGVGLGAFRMDCESVLTELKSRHKQLAAKRRWLMGLPLSDSEMKVFQGREFWNQSVVPESLLREDDIFYETAKTHVRRKDTNKGCELIRNFKSFDSETINVLLSQLNYLTNMGLHHIAIVAARGSNEFHKTRQGMKKMITETMRSSSIDVEDMEWRTEICQHLYELLHDPQFVRGNVPRYLDARPRYTKIAAMKIVDHLDDLPTSVLIAMERKLRGFPGRVPQLTLPESELRRCYLIHRVRKICLKMLSEHGDSVQLQDHLTKALAIAVLSLRLAPGSENHVAVDFHHFTPEIRVLQQRILKAIELLKSKKFPVLKNLQAVLGPGSDLPKKCLRAAISRFLTEYLFECCDMDIIPSSLIEALAIINEGNAGASVSGSSAHNPSIYDENGEVESILGVSALLKQIVLDMLPEMDYAADYSNAYADETEESDEDEVVSHSPDNGEVVKSFHNEGFCIDYGNPLAEGHGDSCAVSYDPIHCIMDSESGYPHPTPNSAPHSGLSLDICAGMDYSGPMEGDFLDGEGNEDNNNGEKTYRNWYLTIQETCDDTSLLAYNIVDFMLEKIAKDTFFYLNEGSILDNHGISSCKENAEGNRRFIKEENKPEYANGKLIYHVVKHLLPNHDERIKQRMKALLE